MKKTKGIYLALLVLLSPMAANADLIDLSGSIGVDGLWEVTLHEGSFASLKSELDEQIWWGDKDLAGIFAEVVGLTFGTFDQGFSTVGPLFAFGNKSGRGWIPRYVDSTGTVNDNGLYCLGSGCLDGGVGRVWATAARAEVPEPTSVPEPGTLALLGLGLAGMSMTRRKRI